MYVEVVASQSSVVFLDTVYCQLTFIQCTNVDDIG